jgi:hypothetical protein
MDKEIVEAGLQVLLFYRKFDVTARVLEANHFCFSVYIAFIQENVALNNRIEPYIATTKRKSVT